MGVLFLVADLNGHDPARDLGPLAEGDASRRAREPAPSEVPCDVKAFLSTLKILPRYPRFSYSKRGKHDFENKALAW